MQQSRRETDKYLPFTAPADNNGVLVSNPTTGQQTFYNSLYAGEGSYARFHTVYEPSPLNRVLKQGAPGNRWRLKIQLHLNQKLKK
ncbi:MAG: DUF6443 domain-containing protein [Mangrovibacterium sp.]